MPLKPVKPEIHRHEGSPIHQPVPIRHAKPMLQRPATSPQLKVSTQRPVGPHPPSTCYRKAPNLPKRHTQIGLDTNELASEQLKLQFYYSRTGDFFFFNFNFNFFPSLRNLLPGLLFDHPPSLPFFSLFLSTLFLLSFQLSSFYPSFLVLLASILLPSQY
jgi:hypothetical protein